MADRGIGVGCAAAIVPTKNLPEKVTQNIFVRIVDGNKDA